MSRKLLGIGIEQELVGIEAMSLLGLIRPVDAIAVELPGADVGKMAVPDVAGPLRQRDALALAAIRASNRQSSTFSACAENSAKLVPLPSKVAPSGCGVPAESTHAQRSGTRKIAASGGTTRRNSARPLPPSRHASRIAGIAAAIDGRIGVEDFAPGAGERHRDAIVAMESAA